MATGCFSFAFRRIPSFLSPADHGSDDSDDGSPLARLFRSKSELNVKKSRRGSGGSGGGYWSKPSLSEADVRRLADRQRYRRVLRDVGSPDETSSASSSRGCNPHVVHRFSKEYLRKHNIDKPSSSSGENPGSCSEEEEQKSSRKHNHQQQQQIRWADGEDGGVKPTLSKTTISFENEVEVFEYDKLEKVEADPLVTHKVQLMSGDDGTMEEMEGRNDDSEEKENPRMLISSRVEDVDLCYDYV